MVKITAEVEAYLATAGVLVRPYEHCLTELSEVNLPVEGKLWLDPDSCSQAIVSALPSHRMWGLPTI